MRLLGSQREEGYNAAEKLLDQTLLTMEGTAEEIAMLKTIASLEKNNHDNTLRGKKIRAKAQFASPVSKFQPEAKKMSLHSKFYGFLGRIKSFTKKFSLFTNVKFFGQMRN